MKIELTREQLDGAVMVTDYNRVGKARNYIQLATGEKYGSSKLCRSTKNLVLSEYSHLIKHGSSTYAKYGCRCSTCKAAKAVCDKPYNDSKNGERSSISKAELQDRIIKELNLSVYECSKCQSTVNLEADHTAASDKLMNIDTFRGYLHHPELQPFISAEFKKSQVLCKKCHNKSNGPDRKTGRARNLNYTPWLLRTINGKCNKWMPTQIIPLLKLLGYRPGDKPKPLNDYGWLVYRLYAHSLHKPFI